jgi:hypothetical protein
MSRSVRFLLLAILLNTLRPNLAHNKPNTFWLSDSSAWPVASYYSERDGLKCSVADGHKCECTGQKCTKKSLQQNEGHRNKRLYAFLSPPTDCIWTHSPQCPDKPPLPWHTNIMRLKPKQSLRIYNDMYRKHQLL